jgi:8-oxo-dGTP pyrophosphatase MutT (NUDIX family)
MAISEWLRAVRAKAGHALVVVPSVTALVFDGERRLLLARNANADLWVAPGGAVDPDESPADAVVREVWEETGLHVAPHALAGVFGGPEFRVRYRNGDEVAYVMAVYECRLLGGAPRPDGEETLEVRWVAAAERAQLRLARWLPVVLSAFEAGGGVHVPPVGWRPPAGG